MFGEIRSLLQNAPSADSWERLCHHVSEWRGPEDLASVVLPYILAHITEWPAHLRDTPLRWKEGLVRGANLPFAPMVRVLDASDMNLRNEDLLTLAHTAPIMRYIEALDLSKNTFGWRGLNHLLSHAPALSQLRALSLDATGVGMEGVRLLAQTEALHALEVLSLASLHLAAETLSELMHSPHLTRLHTLVLSSNGMGERHVEALTRGPRFAQLQTLMLDDNPLATRGAIRLLHRAETQNLRELDLSRCQLAAPILELFAQNRRLGALEHLRLAHNPLTRHLELLARVAPGQTQHGLPALHTLDVRHEGESHRSLLALLRTEAMPALHQVVIDMERPSHELQQQAETRRVRLVREAPIQLELLGPR